MFAAGPPKSYLDPLWDDNNFPSPKRRFSQRFLSLPFHNEDSSPRLSGCIASIRAIDVECPRLS